MAQHRDKQSAFHRNGNTNIRGAMEQHTFVGPGGIGRRHFLQRQPKRLDDHVVDRDLEAVRTILGRHGIDALSCRKE